MTQVVLVVTLKIATGPSDLHPLLRSAMPPSWGLPKIREGYLSGGPHNVDHSLGGSILGSPNYGNYHFYLGASKP